jgi:hypothetical protein
VTPFLVDADKLAAVLLLMLIVSAIGSGHSLYLAAKGD